MRKSFSSRRRFLRNTAWGTAGLWGGLGSSMLGEDSLGSVAPEPVKLQLGFDNFSIRAFGWKAERLLEYAREQELDTLLLSDLHVYESHADAYLLDLKRKADDLGIKIQVGTGSICPSSSMFKKDFGTAEEHLQLAIRIAQRLGSNVVRCFLGNNADRRDERGIYLRIRETIRILKSVKRLARDIGMKIAVENHAGDMQAWELAELVEAAGKDYVGVTVDSGNATWTLEDPLENLRLLAPYVLSSGIRDSMIWETPEGAMVQWTALGDGIVDMKSYVNLFRELCPKAPIQLEIISGFQKPFKYLKTDFWKAYQRARAHEFASYIKLAKKGHEIEPFTPPKGDGKEQAVQDYQREQLERSIRYAKDVLGLGVRGR